MKTNVNSRKRAVHMRKTTGKVVINPEQHQEIIADGGIVL